MIPNANNVYHNLPSHATSKKMKRACRYGEGLPHTIQGYEYHCELSGGFGSSEIDCHEATLYVIFSEVHDV
jgi:hypothetical protein